MLRIRNLTKIFSRGTVNENVAINNVNLFVLPKDFITIVGSNGAGKTTLLNVISGSIIADSGRIEIDGFDVTNLLDHQRAKFMGRVFQNPL